MIVGYSRDMRHVILIPGLGDKTSEHVYTWLRPWWWLRGIKLHVFELHWEDGRDFSGKYRKLKQLANRLPQPLGVVGASAGASAAVNLLAQEPKLVAGAVSVCGVLELSYLDKKTMQRRSPAFYESMSIADKHLRKDKKLATKMLTIRPLADKTVDPRVATIQGARDVVVKTRGHAVSIAYILIFKVGLIKRFLADLEV